MAQISQQWTQGWGVVRRIHGKLEFVAVFDSQADAESAAAQAGIGYQVSWVSYREAVGLRPENDRED